MDTAFLITAFATLFVVIDPIGLAPLFVALTQGMDARMRRAIGLRACLVAFGVLALFGLFGEALLGFVGIRMPAFRIAGGILLFITALDMLFERRTKRRADSAGETDPDDHPDPSIFPIGIPLIAGPGAIATMILLTAQLPGVTGYLTVLAVMGSVLVIVFGLFLMAGGIERVLGRVGTNIVTRILGMLLAALAVQFVIDGLLAFGFGSAA